MKLIGILAASAAVTLAGCSSFPGSAAKPAEAHETHHPAADAAPRVDPARFDQQMKTMQEMHQKMMAAKTPAERQALMAEHMKAMQGGMSMMCEMGSGGGMGMQGGAGSGDMMKRCMEMKDMTMQMMTDRESGK